VRAHASYILQLVFDRGGLGGELAGACCGAHSEVDRCHIMLNVCVEAEISTAFLADCIQLRSELLH
jgi:hypothetical protein